MKNTKMKSSKKATVESSSTKAKATKAAKKATEEKAVQKVIMNRDLKYIYPDAIMNDKVKMKSFRAKVRKAIQKMEADISKAKVKDRKGLRAGLNAYRQEVLVNPSE